MTTYNTNYDLTMPFVDMTINVNMAEATNLAYTVPGASTVKYSARFTYIMTSDVFVGLNVVPSPPSSGVVGVQQYVEYRPGYDGSQRYVKGGDVLNFYTTDSGGAWAGVRFMQVQ